MLRLFAEPANIRAPVFVVAATLPNPAGGWEALQRILRNSLIIPETSLSSRARRYWLIQLAPTAASDLDPQRSSISAKKKKMMKPQVTHTHSAKVHRVTCLLWLLMVILICPIHLLRRCDNVVHVESA